MSARDMTDPTGDSHQVWIAVAQLARIADVRGHVVVGGQQVADDQPTDLSGRAEDGDVHVSPLSSKLPAEDCMLIVDLDIAYLVNYVGTEAARPAGQR
jgi:hypothetical protein